MRVLLLAGVVVCGIAAVVSIVSTAIPYWIYQSSLLATVNQGLWKICVDDSSETICSTYDSADWLKAVKALMITGILFLALSLLLGCLQCKYDIIAVQKGSASTAVLGSMALIIAVIIFGVKERDVKSDFSSGFYLAIVGGVLAFVGAVLLGISKRGSAGYSSI